MKKKFTAWLAQVPSRRIEIIGIIAILFMLCLNCFALQNNARQAIHSLYTKAVAGESISCTQTWAMSKYYKVAIAGLSSVDRAVIDAKIHEISHIYMAQQEALAERNRAYGRNDDPGPGPHVDDNGWKATIPSAWTPPVELKAGIYSGCPSLFRATSSASTYGIPEPLSLYDSMRDYAAPLY